MRRWWAAWYCWFTRKERKGPKAVLMHLVFPLAGALICLGILVSLSTVALVVGAAWIVVGIGYYCVVRFGLHRDITMA